MLLDEIGALAVARKQIVADRNALHRRTPARLEQAFERLEVIRPPALADGLEHFDRHNMVELFAVHVAIVAQLKLHPVIQTRRDHSLTGKLKLGRRQGQPHHLSPCLTGSGFGKAAPAAADLQHTLPRPDIQLANDAPVFDELRRGQRAVFYPGIQGAGITHRRIKPQPVKVIAQIIVRHDVAA